VKGLGVGQKEEILAIAYASGPRSENLRLADGVVTSTEKEVKLASGIRLLLNLTIQATK
jgi:hypothetical protein